MDRQTFDNLAKHRELDFRMQRLDNSVSDISEWLSDTMVKKNFNNIHTVTLSLDIALYNTEQAKVKTSNCK